MSKYTKAERHEIYKKIYHSDSFNSCPYGHLCIEFRYETKLPLGNIDTVSHFEELYLLFPDNWGGDVLENYTDNGKEVRKTILEFCIYMTA